MTTGNANRNRAAVVATAALLAGAAALLLLRTLNTQPGPLAALVAFTPYLLPLVIAATIAAALMSHRLLVVAGVVVALLAASAQVQLYTGDPATSGPELVIATTNLKLGAADTAEVVRFAREHEVDLLAVTELTPGAAAGLSKAGLDAILPHTYLVPAGGARGTGIWSRHPLKASRQLNGYLSGQLVAHVDVPGHGPFTFVAAHPARPKVLSSSPWHLEHQRLRAALATLTGPVVVAGDLNATLDHAPMRRLQSDGFVDAAEATGAGLTPTWPTRRPLPAAVITLDHVLTRGPFAAKSVATRRIAASDHAAFVAVLLPAA